MGDWVMDSSRKIRSDDLYASRGPFGCFLSTPLPHPLNPIAPIYNTGRDSTGRTKGKRHDTFELFWTATTTPKTMKHQHQRKRKRK